MGKVNAMHQDMVEAAFEKGAVAAYYGRLAPTTDTSGMSREELDAYMEGLNEAPYGTCWDDEYMDEE